LAPEGFATHSKPGITFREPASETVAPGAKDVKSSISTPNISILNVAALQGRVEGLRRRARGWRANGEATHTEILGALLASLEEIRPAVEDLRQQSEELNATRDACSGRNIVRVIFL
jgi:hypothetical protein